MNRRTSVGYAWIGGLAAGALMSYGYLHGFHATTDGPSHDHEIRQRQAGVDRRADHLLEEEAGRLIRIAGRPGWNREETRDLVRCLVAHPDFINRLWRDLPESRRGQTVVNLLQQLAEDCPNAIVPVLERMSFNASELSIPREILVKAGSATPRLAVEVAKLRAGQLGSDYSECLRCPAVQTREGAETFLEEILAGAPVSDAAAQFMLIGLKDTPEKLPPEVLEKPLVKSLRDRWKSSESLQGWIAGTNASAPDLPPEYFGNAFSMVALSGTPISAGRFDSLATIASAAGQEMLLNSLVAQGRSSAAMDLLSQVMALPDGASNTDALAASLAFNASEAGADHQQISALVSKIRDAETKAAAERKVFTSWIEAAPQDLPAVLPLVENADLKRDLEEAARDASLKP